MKKMLLLLTLLGLISTVEASNLLLNPEFKGTDTNLGPWNKNSAVYNNEIKLLRGQGPGGKNAIRIDLASCISFKQGPLVLAAGEKYRFGAWVRTKNLKSRNKYFSILIYNNGWYKSVQTSKFPVDTKGKWVKLEKIAVMPKSAKSTYTFCVYGAGSSGTFEMSDPFIIPLSEKGKKFSKRMPRWEEKSKRVTLHYPLLSKVSAATGEMWFSVASPVDADFTKFLCKASYASAKGKKFTRVRTVSFDKFGCAKIRFGKLPVGKGFIRAELIRKADKKMLYSSEYNIQTIVPLKVPSAKRLNNMVIQLMKKPLKKGVYSFIAPEEGWYRIAFSAPRKDVYTYIDNGKTPVVLYRKGEPSETMRYLAKGKHTLRISGKGRVNAKDTFLLTKVATTALYPLLPNTGAKNNLPFRADDKFCRDHVWHTFNTITAQGPMATPREKEIKAELDRRGIQCLGTNGFGAGKPIWVNAPAMAENVRTCPHIRYTMGRCIDESWPNGDENSLLALGEMGWLLQDIDKMVWLWHGVNHYNFFNRPLIHRPHIAGITNMNNSRGKILLETYATVSPDMKKLEEQLSCYPRHMKEITSFIPDSQERFLFIIGSYFLPGGYFIDCFPQCDPKYFFDRYFHTIATDPLCKNIGGVGGYAMHRGDEETFRYLSALIRHYAVEGNRTLYSAKYGYKLIPGYLKNGEFSEGLKYWKASVAEGGAITPRKITGFGKIQGRRTRDVVESGDYCVQFTAGSRGANTLKQTITGLTPGKLYSFFYVTADPDDIAKPKKVDQKFVFNAELKGARIVPSVSYKYRNVTKWSKKAKTRQLHFTKTVFKALKNTVELTFTDKGAPAGQKRVVNFVGVRPYYTGK